MKLIGNLDLRQNQIINVVLDPRATAPAVGKQGQLYYNTNNDKVYRHDGSNWIVLGGISNIESEENSINISIADGVAVIDVNVDDATLEISSTGEVQVKDSGIVTNKIANDAVTSVKITDNAVIFSKIQDVPTMTVIGRVESGTGDVSAISIINDNDLTGADGTNIATAGATKAYIDAVIAGIGRLIGSFNANTATQFPGTSDTKKGDYWYVSVSGTVQGVPLNVGDVLIANVENPSPTDPNDWIFLETNRDQATTTILGVVMLATNAEVQAGTDANKVVTPATLSARTATETRTGLARIATEPEAIAGDDDTTIMTPAKVKAVFDALVSGYTALLPSNTSVAVSHGLNTKFLICEFFIESTGEKILCDYTVTSNAVVTVLFNTPEPANSIRIVIKK